MVQALDIDHTSLHGVSPRTAVGLNITPSVSSPGKSHRDDVSRDVRKVLSELQFSWYMERLLRGGDARPARDCRESFRTKQRPRRPTVCRDEKPVQPDDITTAAGMCRHQIAAPHCALLSITNSSGRTTSVHSGCSAKIFLNAVGRPNKQETRWRCWPEIQGLKAQFKEEKNILRKEMDVAGRTRGAASSAKAPPSKKTVVQAGTGGTVRRCRGPAPGRDRDLAEGWRTAVRALRARGGPEQWCGWNCAALPPRPDRSGAISAASRAPTRVRWPSRWGVLELADSSTVFLVTRSASFPRTATQAAARREATADWSSWESLAGQSKQNHPGDVAATNRDLAGNDGAGKCLVESLLPSEVVFAIVTPPLQARLEDIPLLIGPCRSPSWRRRGAGPSSSSESVAIEALQRHTWPGDVRELGERDRAGHHPEDLARSSTWELPHRQLRIRRGHAQMVLEAIERCRIAAQHRTERCPIADGR